MSFSYRTIKHEESNGNKWYGVHEVFFDKYQNDIYAWSNDPISITSEYPDDIKMTLLMIQQDIDNEILDEQELEKNARKRREKNK